ncbi:MAG: hypothetical protein ABI267_06695 [Ginsengibacter sp.]
MNSNKEIEVSFKEITKSFADDLIYPALLGSILFDLFSTWFKNPVGIMILIIYLADWYFYKFEIKSNEAEKDQGYYYILQICIAIDLTFIYFANKDLLNEWSVVGGALGFIFLTFLFLKSYFIENICLLIYWILLALMILTLKVCGIGFLIISIFFLVGYLILIFLSHVIDKKTT